jgi:hypothetical protein
VSRSFELPLVVAILIVVSVLSSAQNTQDPQAVSVLNSCIAASGGLTAINGIQDFTASGNVTYYWAGQNVQGSVTLKALGTANFRVDAVLQAGTRSWAVSNGTGALIDTDGTRTTVPYYNAVNFPVLSWRLPNIVAAVGNPAVTLTYMGLVQSDAGQAYQVHYVFNDATNPDPSLATVNTIDYFIDPNTYYVLETLDTTYSVTSMGQGLQHEVVFSNYQTEMGVAVPFSLTEKIGGQTTWTADLSGISFNTGLTIANFQL